jgi:ATP-dependent RNA helicase DDX46/PRP5
MDALARRVLAKPLEITVGGRSVVAADIEQIVLVVDEKSKFLRLLEILGQEYDKEKRILIFVDRQEAADNLMRDLMKKCYSCLAIHGGKDQGDREESIQDFKSGACLILIATSVAARGLDVKGLGLVINYECPNHLEDYVHRCGRTGRAGNKGKAVTFITTDQDKFAGDIIKALKMSNTEVPEALNKLWEGTMSLVRIFVRFFFLAPFFFEVCSPFHSVFLFFISFSFEL